MPRRPSSALLLLALAACVGVVDAGAAEAREDDVVRLDSDRSQVDFRVKVLWLVGITGHFGRMHGLVRIDRFRSQVSVEARIDVDTLRMDSKSYETWVKSPEFFDAQRHPRIVFDSDPIPRERLVKGGELPGQLTVRGVRKPVVFEMRPSACERAAYECPIEVEGAIRRSDFGMRSRRGTLSDRVELAFSVYAQPPAR